MPPTSSSKAFLKISLALLCLCLSTAHARVMFNEIMYHPGELDGSEPTQLEFLEIFNSDLTDVDLTGYALTKGVNFEFEEGTVVPAGGYLIIAASPADFRTLYPSVSGVVGPWTGRLSNSGEKIELVDSAGETVDEVRYSDQGDWARRVEGPLDQGHRGWEWQTQADGDGHSLELINPSQENESGQNWTQSFSPGGSPGSSNSVLSADVVAFISEVRHFPAVPKSSEYVTISAGIDSGTAVSIQPTLFWRVSSEFPALFSRSPMSRGADDHVYLAEVPPHPQGTVIEFYVEASTEDRVNTWPAPTDQGQTTNALFQFDDRARFGSAPLYRLTLSEPENAEFNTSNVRSNALFNATFIADDGSDSPTVRYLCGMRVRGAGSRRDTPRPLRIEIPRPSPWNGSTSLNLNTQFTWLQLFGMKLFQAARLPAPNAKRVQVRRNGVDRVRNAEEQFGSYVHLEPLDGDFIDRALPDQNDGNLYKKVRPDRSWPWYEGDINAYRRDGWSKQTNGSANDWVDLDTLFGNFSQLAPDADLSDIEAIADLDQWMRWFAVMSIIANGETNLSNGTDDDYSIYNKDGRFILLPHDLDTIFGEGDGSRIREPTHTIFDMTSRGDAIAPLIPFFQRPEIRERYFLALRELLQTLFQQEEFEALMDQHLGGWVPETRLNTMKSYASFRFEYIGGLIDAELGAPAERPIPTSIESLDRPVGDLILSEVLANTAGADFIELHNTTSQEISLDGYSLSDRSDEPDLFTFDSSAVIGAGEWLMVELGEEAPFSLSKDGESVFLFSPDQVILDDITWGPQIPEFSISRTGTLLPSWTLTAPTPGAAPAAPQVFSSPGDLRINEWLARSAPFFGSDFIELYNPTSAPISLGGLSLSDDPVNDPSQASFPPLSFIDAEGYLLLNARGDEADPENPTDLAFRLSGSNEVISLRSADGQFIDQVSFNCPPPGQTQGRTPEGDPEIALLPFASPGKANISPDTSDPDILNAIQLFQNLRITELMYQNDESPLAEFIELQNIGTTSLDLSGVALTEGVNFTFPDGVTLQPDEYIVVTSDLGEFEQVYGNSLNLAGSYTGRLRNGGEKVTLSLPAPHEVPILSFTYNDSWYPSTDGPGFSLQVLDRQTAASLWDRSEAWSPSGSRFGSPGTAGSPLLTFPQVTNAVQTTELRYQLSSKGEVSTYRLLEPSEEFTIDPQTGILSGFIEGLDDLTFSIVASNADGETTRSLQVMVDPLPAPQITSTLEASVLVGDSLSYQITAAPGTITYSAVDLLPWLSLDEASGLLTGIPPTAGMFTVPITASNINGSVIGNLEITVTIDPLSAAIEAREPTTSSGDSSWFNQNLVTFDGQDAAQSGGIRDNQISSFSIVTRGPKRLNFYWKVSSEGRFDFLTFTLNDVLVSRISGEVDWTKVSVNLPPGEQTLTWFYKKDSSVSNGFDTGWVDLISIESFAEWRRLNGIDPTSPPSADLDGDSHSILYEYALGGSPWSPDSQLVQSTVSPSGEISLNFTAPSEVFGVRYLVERSSDLSTWSTEVIEPQAENNQQFQVIDNQPAAKRFLRLRVEEVPR